MMMFCCRLAEQPELVEEPKEEAVGGRAHARGRDQSARGGRGRSQQEENVSQ